MWPSSSARRSSGPCGRRGCADAECSRGTSSSLLAGGMARSRDLDLADARDGGAGGDVVREQPERAGLGLGFDRPPDRVAAGAAGRERGLMAKRAVVALERGEDDAALLRLVTVVEQVTRHGSSLLYGHG